jgi:hypothetical protein
LLTARHWGNSGEARSKSQLLKMIEWHVRMSLYRVHFGRLHGGKVGTALLGAVENNLQVDPAPTNS